MILSAEQFAAIVRFLKPEEAPLGHRKNSRRAPRIAFNSRLSISLKPAAMGEGRNGEGENGGRRAKPLTVPMRDISPRGVAFLSPQPMARGEQFMLHLAGGAGQGVDILCEVAHCRTQRSGHMVGGEFVCMAGPAAGEVEGECIERPLRAGA
jgi:hypothetical protein